MRLAPPAPTAWRSAPRHCGPWEQAVANLTDGLVKPGIGVSLQPTGDSGTRAKLRSVVARGREADGCYGLKVLEASKLARVFEEADPFGLIHDDFDFPPLMWSQFQVSISAVNRRPDPLTSP
jgi:hypothetical protein